MAVALTSIFAIVGFCVVQNNCSASPVRACGGVAIISTSKLSEVILQKAEFILLPLATVNLYRNDPEELVSEN